MSRKPGADEIDIVLAIKDGKTRQAISDEFGICLRRVGYIAEKYELTIVSRYECRQAGQVGYWRRKLGRRWGKPLVQNPAPTPLRIDRVRMRCADIDVIELTMGVRSFNGGRGV